MSVNIQLFASSLFFISKKYKMPKLKFIRQFLVTRFVCNWQ